MPATRKTYQLRRRPEPASLTLEHPSALHTFPSEWWTVLHATQSLAKLAPASRRNDEQFLDIEVDDHEGQEAELVINFNSTPDIGFQAGLASNREECEAHG